MNNKNGDWHVIEDDREKYSAYLCSREWSELREAVRKRANNKCERCMVMPMDACHHLTYERKYQERLEDLMSICNYCHDYTHGKSDIDPLANARMAILLRGCFPQKAETSWHGMVGRRSSNGA